MRRSGRLRRAWAPPFLLLSLVLLLLPNGTSFFPCVRHRRHRLPAIHGCLYVSSSGETAQLLLSEKDSNRTVEASHAITLQQQALALRAEAESLQRALDEQKMEKIRQENIQIDRWIEELLVNHTINENTEILNSVDRVFERLRDDRYSQGQVNKIFKRICETGPAQSRSNCSPLMSTFVDAVGKLDQLEREDNPNKRWSGRVERVLRRKLFGLDWGIEIEDEEDDTSLRWR